MRLAAMAFACLAVVACGDDRASARPDRVHPELIGSLPRDGSSYFLAGEATLTLRFSECLDPETLDDSDIVLTDLSLGRTLGANVFLCDADGACPPAPVPGRIGEGAQPGCGSVVQVVATLQPASEYLLEIAPSFSDLAGNLLLTGRSIRFRTARTAALPPFDDQDCSFFGGDLWCGDFDGDGLDDVAVFEEGRVRIYGAPTLDVSRTVTGEFDFGWIGGPWEVLSGGDFDADGLADLVVTTWDDTERVHFATALFGPDFSRRIEVRSPLPPGQHSFGRFLAVGDRDGDGFDDVVTSAFQGDRWNPDRNIAIAYGPSFSRIEVIDGPGGFPIFSDFAEILAVGDLDGDGLDEIATLDDRRVYVFLDGSGFETLALEAPTAAGRDRWTLGGGLAVADVTGDAIGDVVAQARLFDRRTGEFQMELHIWPGPDASDHRMVPVADPLRPVGRAVLRVDDLDGDGAADVAFGFAGFWAILAAYGPDFDRVSHAGYPAFAGRSGFVGAISTGDIDGDGLVDIALGCPIGGANNVCNVQSFVLFGP